MTHVMNGKAVSTNELICYVIASVLENVQENFDEYAKVCIKDYNELNEGDFEAIEKWKARVFSKVNTRLSKKNMADKSDG